MRCERKSLLSEKQLSSQANTWSWLKKSNLSKPNMISKVVLE